MVDRREILEVAEAVGLQVHVVEKDYVLGWVLNGIFNHPELSTTWIFKGGTCLKKCYFETYRFSEDLDFTLTKAEHISEEFLRKVLSEVAEWVQDKSGIEIPKDQIRLDIHPDPAKKYVEGKLYYVGPLKNTRGGMAKIILDLSNNEVLVNTPVQCEVYHPYSDRPAEGLKATCYSYEEVFAEKVRALWERLRPRDLYDVVHLFRRPAPIADRALVHSTLEEKCAHKGIQFPTMQLLEQHPGRAELTQSWEAMLRHQLAALPPIDTFWQELPGFFNWLETNVTKAEPPVYTSSEPTWTPPPRLSYSPRLGPSIEKIQLAAANRVCVRLTYHGKTRTIEPISLRQSSTGTKLFYGFEREAGHPKAFKTAEIQSVQLTEIPFTPKYKIDIAAEGPARFSRIESRGSSSQALPRATRSRTPSYGGPIYEYECTYCHKVFPRKTSSGQLNSHKDKNGYPCPGRTGYLKNVKY